MTLRNLKTLNYRNLADNPPQFCKGVNILHGDNAAGKTNTLEAIYLFAAGKSFRTRSDRDFIAKGKEFAHAEICYDIGSIKGKTMAINFLASGQNTLKAMMVENCQVEKASEFLGNFRAVLFTPDHLELVKGAPEERRRLVDMALCQIKPRFVKALNEYAKVLAQRNNYLKNVKIRAQKADEEYLDVLNRLLASAGAVIVKQRGLYCQNLDKHASDVYGKITSDKERLFINYVSKAKIADVSNESGCADALYRMYQTNTHKDIELGRTSFGPHRDELMIYIGKSGDNKQFLESVSDAFQSDKYETQTALSSLAARTFGSQGQQRSAVLAIKMAEGEIVKELCGEYPVFLLDDLFSELDAQRRTRLCSMLQERQCIITSCDRTSIPNMSSMKIINVKDGKYSE